MSNTLTVVEDECPRQPELEDKDLQSMRTRRERAQIKTQPLDPKDLRPSWPLAIASLEKLSSWAVLALRLGTLALIQHHVRELAQENAKADLVAGLRELTEALAHMPLET